MSHPPEKVTFNATNVINIKFPFATKNINECDEVCWSDRTMTVKKTFDGN